MIDFFLILITAFILAAALVGALIGLLFLLYVLSEIAELVMVSLSRIAKRCKNGQGGAK